MQLILSSLRSSCLGLIAMAWLPVACSGKSSNESTSPVQPSDFAAQLAHAYCSNIQSCCSERGYSTATCEASLSAQVSAAVATMNADPRVTYDAAAGAAMIDDFANWARACTDPSLAIKVKWKDVFKGTVDLGGACGNSQDCLNSASCNSGVCTLNPSDPFSAPRATLGQPCSGSCRTTSANSGICSSSPSVAGSSSGSGTCWVEDGLYCDDHSVCAAVPSLGQSCVNYYQYDCLSGAHCDGTTCVADTATGPCSDDEGCVSTSYCATTTSTCTPKKANGAACNADAECIGGQCEQDVCRTWSVATVASCAGLLD